MSYSKPLAFLGGLTLDEQRHKISNTTKGFSLSAVVAVVFGALFLVWPAIYNGFPLMYSDTVDYVGAGRRVAWTLIGFKTSPNYGLHSLIYSVSIFPFHWNVTVWPVIVVQCLLTAFVLWLVVRSILQERVASCFLILMLLLSVFSSLSWYGSLAMPDILGPVLYLSIYLLVFARETISRVERYALYLISWWALASILTNLVVVIGLSFLLVLLASFHRDSLRKNLIPAAELTSILLLAFGAQTALNAFLDARSPNSVTHLPYLTAHLVEEGAGSEYLQSHCGETNWEMCQHLNYLDGTWKDFLWSPKGVWANATDNSRTRILDEDLPLAFTILRTYPMEQLRLFAETSWRQFMSFDLGAFEPHPVAEKHLGGVLPRAQSQFSNSRQEHDRLSRRLFSSIEYGAIIASLASLAALLPWLWKQRPVRLLGLGYVILAAIVLNALAIGAVSVVRVESRFQCCVIWLAPFLAALCALKWSESRSAVVNLQPQP